MKKLWIRSILIVTLFMPISVLAHPGRTDNSGCHTCKTNCASWGLEDGEYHCHNGNTYTNSKGQKYNKDGTIITTNSTTNSNNTQESESEIINSTTTNNDSEDNFKDNNKTISSSNSTIVNKKSSDATISSIRIDNSIITISDNMNYTTYNTNPVIIIKTSDENATYELIEPSYMAGNNEVIIKVTAEDAQTIKEYRLNININKNLSNNVNISLTINNQNVILDNYESETIYIPYDEEELDIQYVLEDNNSIIELDYDKNLDVGDTIIKFKVIAESGKSQIYTLNIYRYDKNEETIYGFITLSIVGATFFGIYKLVKKKKDKSNILN